MLDKKLLSYLAPADMLSIIFLQFLSILNILYHGLIPQWMIFTISNSVITLFIIAIAWYAGEWKTKTLGFLHHWYLYLLVFYIYTQTYFLGYPIQGKDYDGVLIVMDRWIFGVDPTIWFMKFAHPLATEILQVCYFSYYFLIAAVGIEIALRKTDRDLQYFAFVCVYGFYLSYIGYILFPAVGPRVILHDFNTISTELPGLFFTEPIRTFLNYQEHIVPNSPNPGAYVHRNAFPSGHAEITLIVIYLSHRFNLNIKFGIATIGTLLIIGTVYLRYHYVIDLIAGVLFFVFTAWTAPFVFRAWNTIRDRAASNTGMMLKGGAR
jgi:membrane-associated phospholipid phosphatase